MFDGIPGSEKSEVSREKRVIRGRRVENDVWETVGVDPAQDLATLPADPVIVPLKLWKARRDELALRKEPLGVWFGPEDDPSEISLLASHVSLLAVYFPKFGDGRGFSTGTLLRTRYGWKGELRAFGDIGRDHLFHLERCGFDAFRLPDRRDPEDALKAFGEFSNTYQGAVDDPVPFFRKRAALRSTP